MPQVKKALILIPARMLSTRLPGKPMANINGIPMICQVYQRALEADIGTPWVATDSQEVLETVKSYGGKAVMTRSDHRSGSDRIWEAVCKIDPDQQAEFIINVQGDLPTIDGAIIRRSLQPLIDRNQQDGGADIATLAVVISEQSEKTNPNVVKIIAKQAVDNTMRAITFTRATAPWGEGPMYHHIGLYAYRRAALEKFVGLKPSQLEIREKLEQLRAIEADMLIDVSIVDTMPLGVDTKEDLERARRWFRQRQQ
ncbi:MAG: 3-deoxy-manno-octulosonate cytidylyltransferase [Hyphomicrobiales bacterium]|nr:3-deoxy-manno-octulosonate cytidylyltransferase [Hyphomicrobiales bacterium]